MRIGRIGTAGLVGLALAALPTCGGEACRDLAGTWSITQHCEEDFVGLPAVIAQEACDITLDEPWSGFAGQVNADGTMTLGGVVDGDEVINCQGTVTDTRATLRCDDCAVVLNR